MQWQLRTESMVIAVNLLHDTTLWTEKVIKQSFPTSRISFVTLTLEKWKPIFRQWRTRREKWKVFTWLSIKCFYLYFSAHFSDDFNRIISFDTFYGSTSGWSFIFPFPNRSTLSFKRKKNSSLLIWCTANTILFEEFLWKIQTGTRNQANGLVVMVIIVRYLSENSQFFFSNFFLVLLLYFLVSSDFHNMYRIKYFSERFASLFCWFKFCVGFLAKCVCNTILLLIRRLNRSVCVTFQHEGDPNERMFL